MTERTSAALSSSPSFSSVAPDSIRPSRVTSLPLSSSYLLMSSSVSESANAISALLVLRSSSFWVFSFNDSNMNALFFSKASLSCNKRALSRSLPSFSLRRIRSLYPSVRSLHWAMRSSASLYLFLSLPSSLESVSFSLLERMDMAPLMDSDTSGTCSPPGTVRNFFLKSPLVIILSSEICSMSKENNERYVSGSIFRSSDGRVCPSFSYTLLPSLTTVLS